jgi:hypothetical protein
MGNEASREGEEGQSRLEALAKSKFGKEIQAKTKQVAEKLSRTLSDNKD